MKKRSICMLLTLVWMLVVFVSCTSNEMTTSEPGENPTATDAQGELSVYALKSNAKVDVYIKDFKMLYRNVTIEKRVFETQEEFDETVKTELSAGKGPDVIIFDSKTNLDVIKMASNGAFLALDEKMGVNDNLKAEDYLPGALDSGKVDGSQYILPLTFSIPTVTYREGEDIGLEASSFIAYDDWMKALEAQFDLYENDPEHCATIGDSLYEFPLISSNAIPLYDIGSSKQLDHEKVKAVSACIKRMYGDTGKVNSVVKKYGYNNSDFANHYAFNFNMYLDPFYIIWSELAYQQYVGHEGFTISALQPTSEEGVTARVTSYGVVTKGAGEFAYEFLRSAMDSSVQTNGTIVYGLSLNKNVINYGIKTYQNKTFTYNTPDGATIFFNGLTPELTDTLTSIYSGITDVKIYNQTVIDIYKESFKPYFEGNKEFEDSYQEFENKMNLYLTE